MTWARLRAWLVPAALLSAAPGFAADFDPLFYGTNDYGDVGLLQTPTARMRPDGEFGLGVSTVRPYNQVHFFLQVLPWLETTLRYTRILNFPICNGSSCSGHELDKSADVKVRLLREGEYWPAVALGIQDIGGTGLFSSEYLVGSYHWYDFDFSLGLGWGRLGSAGDIPNPFGIFGHHFDRNRLREIQSSVSQGGNPGVKYWFTGKSIGPFGGVEWNTPVKGLALRVEYDGNDYEHEAAGAPVQQALPVNFGLSYRGFRNLDFGIGYERGNKFTARLALYTNFQDFRGVAKTADPAPPPVPPPPPQPAKEHAGSLESNPLSQGEKRDKPASNAAEISPEQEKDFVLRLKAALMEQGFSLIAVDYDESERAVKVWLSQDRYRNPAKAVGRTARVLCATSPAEVTEFTVVNVDQGMETYRATIQRADFEKAARGAAPLETALSSIVLSGPGAGYRGAEFYDASRLPKFSWDAAPAVRQSVGSPQTFYAGQLYARLSTALQVTDHFSLSGSAGFNIINNFDQLKSVPASNLPHVRSDIVRYLQEGGDGVINLEADYLWSPFPDWYHRISAGIFEEMYGGVATELLYRPYGRPWALSFDLNRVKKRGFREQFDFQDYMVTTGHVTLYYRPPFYNLLVKLSAGQYLARDRGATLDISREFASGVRAGVFATKTDVSAAQFGEGSFDKGVYIVIPLDLFFARSTRREASFVFRPLTRDGGQMVYDGPELYSIVDYGEPAAFARGAGELLK